MDLPKTPVPLEPAPPERAEEDDVAYTPVYAESGAARVDLADDADIVREEAYELPEDERDFELEDEDI